MGVEITELHNRLLTGDTAQRPKLEAEAAVTVLRSLKRVVERTASDQTLVEVEAGRWPPEAPILLRSARLATAVASTLDRSTTGAEEPTRDIMHALAPVLRSMARGALYETGGGELNMRPARIPACDAIADLLEWGRLSMPSLATDVDGPLAPLAIFDNNAHPKMGGGMPRAPPERFE